MKNCTFSNNSIKFGHSIKKQEKGFGGAILIFKSIVNGINVNFTYNTANYGGAIAFFSHSKVSTQFLHFTYNIAIYGSALYGSFSCKFSCKECSLYQNENFAENNDTDTTAIALYYHSMINMSGLKCVEHRGYVSSCISAAYNSCVLIYSAMFSRNSGSAVSLDTNSHLVVVRSYFLNNILSAVLGI